MTGHPLEKKGHLLQPMQHCTHLESKNTKRRKDSQHKNKYYQYEIYLATDQQIQIAKKDKGKGKAKKISIEEREEWFVEPAGHHNCLRMFSHNDIDFNEHSIELEEAERLEAL